MFNDESKIPSRVKAQNGGARRGAGRRPGIPNKAAREQQARAKAQGWTPLEVMLYAMRFFFKKYQDEVAKGDQADERVVHKYLKFACTVARDVAPYCHPRVKRISWRERKLMECERDAGDANGDTGKEIDYSKMDMRPF